MKYLRKINEADAGIPKHTIMLDKETEEMFHNAYIHGRSSPNLPYLSQFHSWENVSKKYKLYDDYYLYKDSILQLTQPGDWHWELVKLKDHPSEFRQKILDRIEKLEKAFNMLD